VRLLPRIFWAQSLGSSVSESEVIFLCLSKAMIILALRCFEWHLFSFVLMLYSNKLMLIYIFVILTTIKASNESSLKAEKTDYKWKY